MSGIPTRRNVQVLAGFTAAASLLLGISSGTRAEELPPLPVESATEISALVPEQTAVAPVVPLRKTRVAVVPFSSADGKPFSSCAVKMTPMRDAGRKLSEEIATRMAVWPEYEVIDAVRVDAAIRKGRLEKMGLGKPATLQRLAELTGADVVILGQTDGTMWSGKGHEGASLYASIDMLSVDDAKVLWSVDGCVQDAASASKVIPALADDMVRQLYAKILEADGQPLLAMVSAGR